MPGLHRLHDAGVCADSKQGCFGRCLDYYAFVLLAAVAWLLLPLPLLLSQHVEKCVPPAACLVAYLAIARPAPLRIRMCDYHIHISLLTFFTPSLNMTARAGLLCTMRPAHTPTAADGLQWQQAPPVHCLVCRGCVFVGGQLARAARLSNGEHAPESPPLKTMTHPTHY